MLDTLTLINLPLSILMLLSIDEYRRTTSKGLANPTIKSVTFALLIWRHSSEASDSIERWTTDGGSSLVWRNTSPMCKCVMRGKSAGCRDKKAEEENAIHLLSEYGNGQCKSKVKQLKLWSLGGKL